MSFPPAPPAQAPLSLTLFSHQGPQLQLLVKILPAAHEKSPNLKCRKLILNPPKRVDDPSPAIYDLVSAFRRRKRSHRREQPTSSPHSEEGIRSRAGLLEIAGLGCLGSRVSALILGPAHRNGIVCSCSWLASRSSIGLGFIHFATSGDRVSPILRTTPFGKPEIWHNTCGQHGSQDQIVCVPQ